MIHFARWIGKGEAVKTIYRALMVFFLMVSCTVADAADLEWQSVFSVDTGRKPLDAVVSESGKQIYVLTEAGDIIVYTSDGELEGRVHVGKHIDFIAAGPSDNELLAGSAKAKTLQSISLEFIHDIDVAGAPFMGPADAPVVIAVFMDYQCPYCVRLESVLKKVLEKNPDTVKIAFKQFPLKMHDAALSAAAAALAASGEGKFPELHALLKDDYKSLDDEKILEKAVTLGFDRDQFRQKMADPDIQKRIQKDIKDGKAAGVSGIPSVFINGRRLKKRTLDQFQEMIDRELGKS
jgi:protein-disulfide isomerase